jgi:salicylate hydroxylase
VDGSGKHFVHYFVQSRRLVNFACLIDRIPGGVNHGIDHGEVADALAAYEGWHPQVRRIIEAVDETFIWALFDRAPLPRWSVGRVDAVGRCLPSHAAVHGAGRRPGDRGRRLIGGHSRAS